MMPNAIAIAAFAILLFPAGFFLLSAPAFLLVKLDITEVTQLLRGLFHAYFLMMGIAGSVGTLALAVVGRWPMAICFAVIVGLAVWLRRRFLRQMDAQLRARDAGDAAAVRRLRRLHWEGMLCNVVFLAAFGGSIPFVMAS
jgi:hypothetical protein